MGAGNPKKRKVRSVHLANYRRLPMPKHKIQTASSRLLTSHEVAEILRLAPSTVQHYTANAKDFGHLLPKWFNLPGHRRNLWHESVVFEFLRVAQNHAGPNSKLLARSRGRPSKRQQLANERERSSNGPSTTETLLKKVQPVGVSND